MNIKGFAKEKGIELKDTTKEKPSKEFAKLSTDEKWAIMEKIARDLGYIN